MKSKSYVLVVGDGPMSAMTTVQSAVEHAGVGLSYVSNLDTAVERVQEQRPVAVLTSLADESGMARGTHLRTAVPGATLPMIGLSEEPTDLVFEEAYRAGFDDVCSLHARRIGRRIRQICQAPAVDTAHGKATLGAVIAEPDATSRTLISRVFREAGYEVVHASDMTTLEAAASKSHVRVAVVGASFAAEPSRVRSMVEGRELAVIVNTPPKEIGRLREALGQAARMTVHDSFAPPETLLFVANEILNRPAVEARASERLLYGAVVRFRHAGRDDVDLGHMYNLSAGGLYVRTLAPPERWDELWLEFMPPRSDKLVHLEGTAVWARRFGPGSAATMPCGFGLQITGGSQRDLQRYGESYRKFLNERSPGEATTPPPAHAALQTQP